MLRSQFSRLVSRAAVALVFAACLPLAAQDRPLYWASVAAVTAANVADVHSSLGKLEANPLLRSADGRFGSRGVTIKSGIAAGNIGVQALILRRWPKARKAAAIANFIAAGALVAVAARNYRQ